MNILLSLVKNWTPPDRESIAHEEVRTSYGFDQNPQIEQLICDTFTDLFASENRVMATNPLSEIPLIQILAADTSQPYSHSDYYDATLSAVKLLNSGGFDRNITFFPFLVASHASNSEVYQPGNAQVKKTKVDLEQEFVINKLYSIGLKYSSKPLVLAHVIRLIAKSTRGVNHDPVTLIDLGLDSRNLDCTSASIELIRAVLKTTPDKMNTDFTKSLLDRTSYFIKSTGWPTLNVHDQKTSALRSKAYELIGTLMRQKPSVMTDVSQLNFLFEGLEKDTAEMKSSIQDALAEVLPISASFNDTMKDSLKKTLRGYLADPEYNQACKYVAVRYAVRVTPFSDPEGRILCLLGLHHQNRADVIEEARRGLHPYWHQLVNSQYSDTASESTALEFPKFTDLMNVYSETEKLLQEKHIASTMYEYSTTVFTTSMSFLEKMLSVEAAKFSNIQTIMIIDENWESRTQTAISLDKDTRDAVRLFLASDMSSSSNDQVRSFIDLVYAGITALSDPSELCEIWARILSHSPPSIISSCTNTLTSILPMVESEKPAVRESASKALGIIGTSSDIPIDKIVSMIRANSIEDQSSSLSSEKIQGRIMAVAAILSRLSFRNRLEELSNIDPSILQLTIDSIKQKLLNGETNGPTGITNACCDALYDISLGKLLVNHDREDIRKRLIELAKKDNEKAILTFGALSINENDESIQKEYVDSILSISTSKHVEFMFSSGEAITLAASQWASTITDRTLDIQGIDLNISDSYSHEVCGYTVDKVIENTKSSKPSLRKISCLWLLSLTQYCSGLVEISDRLEKIHLCFMRFLAERDDIVQESASRGLGIIYELGDENLKRDLVKGLVQSFTSESKNVQAGTVSEETELFEPGVLNTGDGSSVSTYKDILNLATEVGDPSLVYKFMSMAAHSALWASRRGAAFGLGNILSKANLDEIFESNAKLSKSLIPKLFRYRFDPNSSVQQSMRDIWNVLIKDKTASINNNFYDILEELLSGMGNREWRVRQASCAAMQDLLQGRPIEKYQDRLEDIWRMTFRVVDDIKESVRTAAMALSRGLTTSLVRHVDISSGASQKVADEILNKLIPFLTGNYGLQSDAQEVQQFALDTLLQLTKKAGKALKPYIPALCEEFIGLLSTLEPQSMNYLALNADKYGMTTEDVDASRMASLRGSPMMDAVEQMIELVDEDIMEDFVAGITKVVKRSVGLPSKLAASRVLVSLTVRRLHQTEPYADKLLGAAKSQLSSHNDTVAQSYAISAGYICRMASHQQVLDYASYLQDMYFESEDEKGRRVSAAAIAAVAKHSGDKFDSLASAFLPLVFIAKHDLDSVTKEKFEQTWSDNTGGTGAIKLHIKEIIDIVNRYLSSQKWSVRQIVAKSIAEASESIGNDATTTKNLDDLYKVLLQASSGRSWSGKELVFDALVSLAVRTKSKVLENEELFTQINKTAVTEVKRKNKEYQREAIPIFAKYVKEFPTEDLYTILFEVADIYLEPSTEDDEDEDGDSVMNNNGKVNSMASMRKEEDRNKVLKGVLENFTPRNVKEEPIPEEVLKKMVHYVAVIFTNNTETKVPFTWKTKITVLNGTITISKSFEKYKSEAENYAEVLMELWSLIVEHCAKDLNHEKIRTDSVKAGKSLMDILPSRNQEILTALQSLYESEKSTVVQAELKRVIN